MKIIYCGKSIRLLDLENERSQTLCNGHTDTIRFFQVFANNMLISCSYDGSIKVWNLSNGECLRTLSDHSDIVTKIQMLSPDRLISCSFDTTIKLWCIDIYDI